MSNGSTPRATITPGKGAYREPATGTIRLPITVVDFGQAEVVLTEADAELLHAGLSYALSPLTVSDHARDL